jgi:putative copper resistance protein D
MLGSVGTVGALQPLTWGTGISSWQWSYGWDALVAVLAAGYALGLWRLLRGGGRWSPWRALSFGCGLVALVLAVNSGISVYSTAFFSMHMVQHLTLIMVVPYLLVAGHPLTLWVRSAPEGRRDRRLAILRSRPLNALTLPPVAFAIYALVLAGTHLTSFLQVMLLHPWLHQLEIGMYLGSGYLCFLPVLGFEPIKWQHVAIPLRMVVLMVAMLPDTGIGVVLMMADHVLFPAFAHARPPSDLSLIADQRMGGAIMWVAGDGLMAVALIVLAGIWITHNNSAEAGLGDWLESARLSALTRGTGDYSVSGATLDSDEAALERYNAMLARLNGTAPEHSDGQEGTKPPHDPQQIDYGQ